MSKVRIQRSGVRLHISIGVGRWWLYLSEGPHWFLPFEKDENGTWFGSLSKLKIIRYPIPNTNPGRQKGNRFNISLYRKLTHISTGKFRLHTICMIDL